jgi:alcohol dehydrogenase YqhD (iron-dependent ADH family)
VGGGSVIDSAKAIAIGVDHNGDVWDFYSGKAKIVAALPIAAILTIPAAGSETSVNSVINNEEIKLKAGAASELIRPVFSIVNPEIFYSLPWRQAANGVADMMSHIFERYFTNTLHTDLTDGLCESTLKTIMKNALILKENIKDYDAWNEVSFAGMLAHNGFLGLGREQDWACHAMEHPMSAIYDIAHGAGLAALTPTWMRYVYKTNVGMFAQFALNVMGAPYEREAEKAALGGIARLEEFFKKLDLPITISQTGIDEKNFELMAKTCTGAVNGKGLEIGGLKKLGWQDVLNIYKAAL